MGIFKGLRKIRNGLVASFGDGKDTVVPTQKVIPVVPVVLFNSSPAVNLALLYNNQSYILLEGRKVTINMHFTLQRNGADTGDLTISLAEYNFPAPNSVRVGSGGYIERANIGGTTVNSGLAPVINTHKNFYWILWKNASAAILEGANITNTANAGVYYGKIEYVV